MRRRNRVSWLTLASIVAIITCTAATVGNAAPVISNLSLRGLQTGAATTIVVSGQNLLPEPRLVMAIPIARQEVKPGASASRVELEVTLDAATPPGIYQLRIASGKGISAAVPIGVDALPQQPFADKLSALPVALHGGLSGGQILRTTFDGRQGQAVVVDVEAQRLGSKLNPVVRVYDPRGTQLAYGSPHRSIADDARCALILPRDGTYAVELHDRLYRGANPGFFRLKIGELHYADLAFPLGISRGATASIQFAAGNVPLESTAPAEAATDPGDSRPAPAPPVANFTGGRPQLVVSDHAELTEAAAGGDTPQEITPQEITPQVPVAVSGRVASGGEQDRYLLSVTSGAKLRFEVLAARVGSPLDGVLILRGEKGNELARNDDQPGALDPMLDFTVPNNVTKLVVVIQDLLRRGGDDFLYRLSVRDLNQPDFSLSLDADTIDVPAGGTQVVKVTATRAGYNGSIKLSVAGLPDGVVIGGDQIAAGQTVGLLTITAPASQPLSGLVTIVGQSDDSTPPLTRGAEFAAATGSSRQPWFRNHIGFAVTEPAPLTVAWTADAAEPLLLGGKRQLSANVARGQDVVGPIRFRLLTPQIQPTKKIKKDNKEETVDDIERTLRLAGETKLAPDTANATLTIAVPGDLPETSWSLVLVAELLTADEQKVVATAFSPAVTLPATRAFTVELSSPNTIDAKAGDGEIGEFRGKIVRRFGDNGPITITLEGLPDEYPAPSVTVAADQNEFTLPVRFPKEVKPMELKTGKLVGTSQPDPPDADAILRSNELPVVVKVVAGQ